ncbi:MAG: hypothetical protein WD716_13130 [Fimbriimonadaceae bacterium]
MKSELIQRIVRTFIIAAACSYGLAFLLFVTGAMPNQLGAHWQNLVTGAITCAFVVVGLQIDRLWLMTIFGAAVMLVFPSINVAVGLISGQAEVRQLLAVWPLLLYGLGVPAATAQLATHFEKRQGHGATGDQSGG